MKGHVPERARDEGVRRRLAVGDTVYGFADYIFSDTAQLGAIGTFH